MNCRENELQLNHAKFLDQINFPDAFVGIFQLRFSSKGPLVAYLKVLS